jgi:hypothetical protein
MIMILEDNNRKKKFSYFTQGNNVVGWNGHCPCGHPVSTQCVAMPHTSEKLSIIHQQSNRDVFALSCPGSKEHIPSSGRVGGWENNCSVALARPGWWGAVYTCANAASSYYCDIKLTINSKADLCVIKRRSEFRKKMTKISGSCPRNFDKEILYG